MPASISPIAKAKMRSHSNASAHDKSKSSKTVDVYSYDSGEDQTLEHTGVHYRGSTKKSSNIDVVKPDNRKFCKMALFVICELIITFLMVFGGILPYYPQYITIMKKKDETGFSTLVCLTLLVANLLRIIFWFGRRFENVLLLQSVVMVMAMLAMLHLCITVRNQNDNYIHSFGKAPKRVITDMNISHFWDWTEFSSYVSFLMTFYALFATMMYFGMANYYFVELVGGIALLCEALLATPQLMRNYKTSSTAGLSIWMVVGWAIGDVFKTAYFIVRKAPAQFYLCGSIQVIIDMLIFVQFIYYKGEK